MNRSARLRRSAAVIALAGSVMAEVIGFVHVIQPDPGYAGGIGRPAVVQHVHPTGPNWSGG